MSLIVAQVATQVLLAAAVINRKLYTGPLYQNRLKKTHFDYWYRACKAYALLRSAAPDMLAANDKWFEENNMTEGALCGKRKELPCTSRT